MGWIGRHLRLLLSEIFKFGRDCRGLYFGIVVQDASVQNEMRSLKIIFGDADAGSASAIDDFGD